MFTKNISELLKEFAEHQMTADVQLKIKNPNNIALGEKELIVNITGVSSHSRDYEEGKSETVYLEGEIQ